MMWLMDHVFKYTNFGLVSLIHGDFFIRQVSSPKSGGLTFDFNVGFFFLFSLVVSINTVCFTFLAYFFNWHISLKACRNTFLPKDKSLFFHTCQHLVFFP